MRVRNRIAGLLIAVVLMSGCVPAQSPKKRPSIVEGRAGQFIAGYGFSIDAAYDSRLDGVIPGYKLLTVVIRNTSLQVIPTDGEKDKWLLVDERGRGQKAINNLRLKDRKLWREVPEKLRNHIEYPESVPIGYTVAFDLLFPKKVNPKGFQEIRYKNALWGQEFRISKE